ncbi:peptidase S10 [Nakamurella sp. A5-74]|uniref:Peptidase S10 n=1 Tax=Nakamurella sp. A5-74 TaxID=3158264 RepID=A0AAU8DML0_9ACTN
MANTDTARTDKTSAPDLPAPSDEVRITRHTLRTPDGELAYTATAGRVVVREEKHTDGAFDGYRPAIEMFVVSYTVDGVDPATRPVTFAFNGGPGSSSVWLHLGLLGPRRVLAGDAGAPVAPPYRIVENAESLLAHSDLVFIDPVSTGYSRPVVGGKPADYHGYTADRDAMAEMIRLWTTRHHRWLSPKFLAGESYGTLRAAALAARLSERIGMTLNGLMLVSTVLDMGSIRFTDGNDAVYPGFLPTYAAYAHYHGLHGDRSLDEVVQQARELAERDYPWALARGSRLSPAERTDVVERVAAVTGLRPEYVDRANLRIEHQRFFAELLRDRGVTVGRLDGRFTGPAADRNADAARKDVSYLAFQTPYTAAVNHYLQAELGYESDLPYEILSDRVQPWSYAEFEGRGVTVIPDLDAALRANPFLQVHVSLGWFDGATPFAAAENGFARMDLPDELRENISYSYYEAGHMMYLHEQSRVRQSRDLADFVRRSVPQRQEPPAAEA